MKKKKSKPVPPPTTRLYLEYHERSSGGEALDEVLGQVVQINTLMLILKDYTENRQKTCSSMIQLKFMMKDY